jgi:N-acetylglucosamine-6-phosphate deacetylase
MSELPGSVRLDRGEGGLPVLRVDGPEGWAEIYLHGAHVTAWAPRGLESELWRSAASAFRADVAIRGGVPICFPWFGPLAGRPDVPRHGFARVSEWSLESVHDDGADVTVRLRLTDSDATRASAWPHRFEAICTVVVGSALSITLEVTNRDDVPVTFEEALHTYLRVADVRSAEVTGLEGAAYLDKLAGPDPVAGAPDPVHFTSEVDRVYLGTRSGVTLRDVAAARAVRIGKDGSDTTVVWNPWIDGARATADIEDDGWRTMVCVEASNVGASAVRLEPGRSHVMTTRLGRVAPGRGRGPVGASHLDGWFVGTTRRPGEYLRGRVVTPTGVIEDGVVVVLGDAIGWVGAAAVAAHEGWPDAPDPVADPVTLLPGLVDLHAHGGGGASFPDATTPAEALVAVREHRDHGTTTLVASLVTAAPATLRQRVGVLAALAEAQEIAGIHLEGPFVAQTRCGAQDPLLIQAPDVALVRELAELARGHLVTMTVAPELPGIAGDGGVAEALIAAGALPSFGHTDASWGQTAAALADAHARLDAAPRRRSARATVTHLFNGMRPLAHRDPGPIPAFLAAAARGEAVIELIGDGTHLAPELVQSIFSLVGAQNIALVTDAMAAAGMADGAYRLGSLDVTVEHGVARLAHGGAIAGGTAHLLDIVRTTVAGGVPLVDAVLAAATTPAAVLGDERVGALEAGRRADIVVTDGALKVLSVRRGGEVVTP